MQSLSSVSVTILAQFQCQVKAPIWNLKSAVTVELNSQSPHQSNAYPRLLNTSQYKVLLYLHRLAVIWGGSFWDPIWWVWGVRGPRGSIMVLIKISSPHSYSTSIPTVCLSCTFWPQYTTRQTEQSEYAKTPHSVIQFQNTISQVMLMFPT